jgi:NAD(P)-dependent dehydrogenase (short-subunit alcohol dehydrogenase family)
LSQRDRPVRNNDRPGARPAGSGQSGGDKARGGTSGGLIEPEDIANMAVFLASEEARMITGHVYPVDSGVTIS